MSARRSRTAAAILFAVVAIAGVLAVQVMEDRSKVVSPVVPPSTPTASPDTATALADRCLSLTPRKANAAEVRLDAPAIRLVGAVVEAPAVRGEVGVILLPQVGGFCGWMPFAELLADSGVTALPLDLCGYGESACAGQVSVSDQVDVAARHLRRDFGASRVVLVGASMGGSQAVRAVAGGADVDAWANISGPSAWDGDRLLDLAPQVPDSGLVVYARRDGDPAEFARARALAARTDSTFVPTGGGHGWDLLLRFGGGLTPIGKRVLNFVCSSHGCDAAAG